MILTALQLLVCECFGRATNGYYITTIAGSGKSGYIEDVGRGAVFSSPRGIAVDSVGNLYIADTENSVIRKMAPSGSVYTLAGLGYPSTADGSPSKAGFYRPQGLVVDPDGNVYVADTGGRTIRKITQQGFVTTLAGSYRGSGSSDGNGTNASFLNPVGITIDSSGNLYISEGYGVNTIRRVSQNGDVVTIAGTFGKEGWKDGAPNVALFAGPTGISVAPSTVIWVADSGNSRIREVNPANGNVMTYSSSPMDRQSIPMGIVSDGGSGVFYVDFGYNTIVYRGSKFPEGAIAGQYGGSGSVDGYGSSASFAAPSGICKDDADFIYVTDLTTSTIRLGSPVPLGIAAQPVSKTAVAGNRTVLGVRAGGALPIKYQWHANGTNIAGQTKSYLAFTSVSTADAGDYWVTVSNQFGVVDSAVATLTVVIAPTITQQPQSQSVALGSNVVFSVAATNDSPITYQWRFNGESIAGATSTNYVISNVRATNAGTYAVLVSDSDASILSSVASLTVLLPPTFMSEPGNQTVVLGGTAAFSAAVSGTQPLSYQWQHNGTNIDGATQSNISLYNVSPSEAGAYTIIATNAYGSITSKVATLTVRIPPSISLQPASQGATAGSNVTFSVRATGEEPLSYQWLADGTNIAGATSPDLILTGIGASDAGDYNVRVSNGVGTAYSSWARLSVYFPPSIIEDPVALEVLAGNSASFSVRVSGDSPFGYQWRLNGIPVEGATFSDYSIPAVGANNDGEYTVVVTNHCGAVTSAVATLVVLLPPTINSQPTNQSIVLGKPVTITVDAKGTPLLSYQWRFNGIPIGGNYSQSFYSISRIASANAGKYDVVIANQYGSVTSQVAVISVLNPPAISLQPTNQTIGLGSNAVLVAGCTGDAPLKWQWFQNGACVVGATNESLAIKGAGLQDGGSYLAVVTNSWGFATSRVAVLTVLEPPWIAVDPASQTVLADTAVTMSVDARGSLAISYQWLFNGTKIQGANSSVYSIPEVSSSNAGDYSVVVSNVVGSITTRVAKLTVLVPARITLQPQSQSVGIGSNVNFSVSAQGDLPLSYQWRFNGRDIAGETSAGLGLSGVAQTNSGQFCVVVRNACGAVTSSIATLTVCLPPCVLTPPRSCTNGIGSAALFDVTASGTAPLSYQWLLNGSSISGATNAAYSIPTVGTGHAGNYAVLITNIAGKCTSAVATLTVPAPPYIATQPTNQTARINSGAFFSVVAAGGAPLSYQWQLNGTNISGGNSNTLSITNVNAGNVGYYRVVVTNVSGSVTSRMARLTLATPPIITSQPQSRTNVVGTIAEFVTAASGTTPLAYQWQCNGTNIPLANFAGLSIYNVTAANAGAYTVIVTNAYGSVTSIVASLSVPTPPSILEQPRDRTVGAGTNVTFSVTANGDSPLSCKWRFNGVDLVASDSLVLALPGVSVGSAGEYSVVITNRAGAITSRVAVLSVLVPPGIVRQPLDCTNNLGTRAEFSVSIVGSEPLAFQWQWGGTNIGGANSTNHVIPAVTAESFGGYSVIVSNSVGSVTSRIAVLNVLTAPRITKQPASQSIAIGAKAILSVDVVGAAPLVYQWKKNGVALAVSTRLTGVTNAVLTIQSMALTDAGTYSVLITNRMGQTVSSNAILTAYVPDSRKPVLTLVSPKAGQQYVSNLNVFTAIGSASDNGCVSNVFYRLNTNAWALAYTSNGWKSWSAALSLRPGTNLLNVFATDSTGNCSATTAVKFVYVPVARLVVVTNSSGSVSPYTNGQWLKVDSNYVVTAKPAAGWLFSNWTGTANSSVNPLSFTMRTNTVLQPVFVPSPFLPVAGSYQGLFIDNPDNPSLGACGAFTLNLTPSGGFSAALSFTNKNWPFSGQFTPGGTASNNVVVGKSNCAVVLQVDMNGGGEITGSVRNKAWTSSILAQRAGYSISSPAPQLGCYTLVVPGSDYSHLQPGGDSYAFVSVDGAGKVTMTGMLADGTGTVISQNSALSVRGQWPVYSALPSGGGAVFGWLIFTNEADNDLNGMLTWIKPANKGARFYQAGFTNISEAIGSRYASNGMVLKLSSAQLELEHGNLRQTLASQFQVLTNNTIKTTNKALTLTFTPSSGLFSGVLVSTNASGGKVSFKGVVLQKQTNGFGFFAGTNQTGRAVITQ